MDSAMVDAKNMALNAVYGIVLIAVTVLSWGFVDANSSLPRIVALQPILYFRTIYPTVWYTGSLAVSFGWYLWMLHRINRGAETSKHIWQLIALTAGVLIWSYPAFSNDIFNYIATAKVAFQYRENPYIIMPIDLPGEPSFTFLHAANKVALYGPVWIALTGIPHFLGGGNLLGTLFTFKFFVGLWYLVLCYLIWIVSEKKPRGHAFFAFNPLVVLSTLVDGHNDVVMMAIALSSFLVLRRRFYMGSTVLLIASIFIKGATLFLAPIVMWCIYLSQNKKMIPWQRVWYWAGASMYIIFLLSPIREEFYAWYFIWPLTFLALVERATILHAVSYGFSFGLMLRLVPFLYTRSWSGMTPLIKKIVTFVPPLISLCIYGKTPRR